MPRSKRLRTAIAATVWAFAAGGSLTAQAPADERFPISKTYVAAALRPLGLNVKPSQVHLPMLMSSASASPEFAVVSSERISPAKLRILLRCEKAAVCTPFYATVEISEFDRRPVWVNTEGDGKAQDSLEQAPTANRSGLAGLDEKGRGEIPAPVRVGDRLVLLMREGHLHIQLPVVAIDTATVGSQIRVCTLDHKKTFEATVLDQNTAEGIVQ